LTLNPHYRYGPEVIKWVTAKVKLVATLELSAKYWWEEEERKNFNRRRQKLRVW
jgi:hypothetical protein